MGTGASRRKLIKAKINLFSVEYRVTEKRGGSLSIFAVLTARTLYTYKYEVAINNDKVHRPALSFLSRDLLECHLRQVNKEAHLSGRPGDTSPPPYTGAPRDTLLWRTRCWQLARLGDFLFRFEVRGKLGLVCLAFLLLVFGLAE